MIPHNFFLLRTPLQSLNQIKEVNSQNALFNEALYIASFDLWNEIQKETLIPDEKTRHSVLKYWLRSCSRCTPFGLFAGTGIVYLSDETNIELNTKIGPDRKVRLDMSLLWSVVSLIERNTGIQDQLNYFVNNSLYNSPFDIRYAEASFKNTGLAYNLTSVEKSEYLSAVLSAAGKGASIRDLSTMLALLPDTNFDEAYSFIIELIDSQILKSELEISVSGQTPLTQLISCLKKYKNIENILTGLMDINTLLTDKTAGAKYYEHIRKEVNDLGLGPLSFKNTFQVDAYLTLKSDTIDKGIINELLKKLNKLLVLSQHNRNPALIEFKSMFAKKFEETEVPLSIALDADLGVGYHLVKETNIGGSYWVDDLSLNSNVTNTFSDDSFQHFLQQKYIDYIESEAAQIEITESDLKSFKAINPPPQFSNGMYVMGSFQKLNNEFNSENFQFNLDYVSGSSGANLIARFTHGDETLLEFTREVIRKEEAQYPDVIFAEIIHLPESKLGNVLLRPVLRSFEIPYVGKSGIAKINQIEVDDLFVSVQDNEIILRSKRLNKRIIPRLTTAHNYNHKSLPIYKFLCDLQHQGVTVPRLWSWSQLSQIKVCPRVIYENIIISKASWWITIDDVKDFPQKANDYTAYFSDLQVKFKIPPIVVYVESDNKLLIDFNDPDSSVLLFKEIQKRKRIQIEEFLFDEHNCIVHDADNNPFTNEVVIPVIKTENIIKYQPLTKHIHPPSKYLPGSEWLYFKIYSGVRSLERLLLNHITPFVKKYKSRYEKFFFIRYVDERPHIRIRFYNSDKKNNEFLNKKFNNLVQELLENGYLDAVQIDTYNREITRYNPLLMETVETIFYHDSMAILDFLQLLEESDSEFYRISFCMRSIMEYLREFNILGNEQYLFVKQMAENYFLEHGGSVALKKQLNLKYKNTQKRLVSYMNYSVDQQNGFEEANAILVQRSQNNVELIEDVLCKIHPHEQAYELNNLVGNIIHMSINRAFSSYNRRYELLIYFFLERHLFSVGARLK